MVAKQANHAKEDFNQASKTQKNNKKNVKNDQDDEIYTKVNAVPILSQKS